MALIMPTLVIVIVCVVMSVIMATPVHSLGGILPMVMRTASTREPGEGHVGANARQKQKSNSAD